MTRRLLRVLLASVVAFTIVACSRGAEETPTPTPEITFGSLISVTGQVVPEEWAPLSVETDGLVKDVLVEPGDKVSAGHLLVRLDKIDAELAIHEAEAQLARAEAQVAQLRAEPPEIDVATAKHQVDEAEAALDQAIAERDRLGSGVVGADIAQAQAELESAEAQHKAARIDYDELQDELEDDVVEDWEGEKAALELRAARESLDAARLSLISARGSAPAKMEEVEAAVRAAETRVDVARAQFKEVRSGALKEEIELAETEMAEAQLDLEEARLRLERSELRAPFDGTVSMVDVRQGERVRQGQQVVILADLSTLRVETTDLDEIDVMEIDVGQSVELTFDAFPERVFEGRVTRVSPMPQAGDGGVNYTAIIALEELAPEIRWGMTAFVDIAVGE